MLFLALNILCNFNINNNDILNYHKDFSCNYYNQDFHLEKEKYEKKIYIKNYLSNNSFSLIKEKINSNVNLKTNLLYWYDKDKLFEYRNILEKWTNDDYVKVDYVEKIDLYERDIEPVDKVKEEYIDISYIEKWYEKEEKINISWKELTYFIAKKDDNIDKLVIYIHWWWWNRFQGMSDYTFGWNFNRVKNLMIHNTGAYISPDFSNFWYKGQNEIHKIILNQKEKNKNLKNVFIACGSSGWEVCWGLFNNEEFNKDINWIILVWSSVNYWFFNNKEIKKRLIPIFLGHWTNDKQIWYQWHTNFFNKIKQENINYPIKLHLYNTWVHWTPIRMINWKETIEWMLLINNKN